ncbi:unnamed protein product [Phytophthora lilii]|uniref:Condensin complex subunit 2 n=1 Tax=Phytophthora lilii TaxID=2077276 RepID=A0A9W6TZT2_9STRA|nr:unnamed protein product [Phytophthora lilii]
MATRFFKSTFYKSSLILGESGAKIQSVRCVTSMATGGEAKSDDSDVEQYELTEDEDEAPKAPERERGRDAQRATGKRKRSLSQNDEEEIARRRRKRRSLAFQQRRRSLTPSERKAGAAGGAAAAPAHSKQYISDMYSTIIKMSSENVGGREEEKRGKWRTEKCVFIVVAGAFVQKINVKNSWSLHLIDHMEDILDSSKYVVL